MGELLFVCLSVFSPFTQNCNKKISVYNMYPNSVLLKNTTVPTKKKKKKHIWLGQTKYQNDGSRNVIIKTKKLISH